MVINKLNKLSSYTLNKLLGLAACFRILCQQAVDMMKFIAVILRQTMRHHTSNISKTNLMV